MVHLATLRWSDGNVGLKPAGCQYVFVLCSMFLQDEGGRGKRLKITQCFYLCVLLVLSDIRAHDIKCILLKVWLL